MSQLPQLPRDQVPQGVSREVADQSRRPMHVLEHAVGVIFDVDPEVLLEACVPSLGKVLDSELAVKKLLLELEPENDVQRVSRLVGLDANERRVDPVDCSVERVRVDAR